MAAFHARPSILLRPKKAPGSTMSNSQHLEMEHAREEARLAAKREQRQQREHVRGQQLWGDASDKAELAAQNRADHDAQREARRQVADAERAQQQQLSQQMQQREAETRRAEMAKIEAKREYLARLREDNLRLAEQRKSMQHHRREEEKAMAAQSDTEQTFLSKFGRHAVSDTHKLKLAAQ